MLMRKGQVYRCQNPRCGAELQVERESADGFSNPICCCGAEMARQYDAPALRKVKPSPEVMVLLKLLAEIHGFELVEKAPSPDHAEPADPAQPPLESASFSMPSADGSRLLPLEQVRDLHVQRVLEMCGGNRARTAQMLGISRNSLYRTLKRIGQVRRRGQAADGEEADLAERPRHSGVREASRSRTPAHGDQFDPCQGAAGQAGPRPT
jgi:hypothetical protein